MRARIRYTRKQHKQWKGRRKLVTVNLTIWPIHITCCSDELIKLWVIRCSKMFYFRKKMQFREEPFYPNFVHSQFYRFEWETVYLFFFLLLRATWNRNDSTFSIKVLIKMKKKWVFRRIDAPKKSVSSKNHIFLLNKIRKNISISVFYNET